MFRRLLCWPVPGILLSNVTLVIQLFLIQSVLNNCARVRILKWNLIVENGCLHIWLHSLSLNIRTLIPQDILPLKCWRDFSFPQKCYILERIVLLWTRLFFSKQVNMIMAVWVCSEQYYLLLICQNISCVWEIDIMMSVHLNIFKAFSWSE